MCFVSTTEHFIEVCIVYVSHMCIHYGKTIDVLRSPSVVRLHFWISAEYYTEVSLQRLPISIRITIIFIAVYINNPFTGVPRGEFA